MSGREMVGVVFTTGEPSHTLRKNRIPMPVAVSRGSGGVSAWKAVSAVVDRYYPKFSVMPT